MCILWNFSINLQRVFHGIRLLRLINESYLSRDKYCSNSMRNTNHFLQCEWLKKREPEKVPFLRRFHPCYVIFPSTRRKYYFYAYKIVFLRVGVNAP